MLKPGGRLLVLEFSHAALGPLEPLYELYSFQVLPRLGEWLAGDAASYRYLAESIRRHPDQETLKGDDGARRLRALRVLQPDRGCRRAARGLSPLKLIEAELNRCVGESTAARDLLARLAGTSFAVHVEGLGVTAVLHADGERLRVDADATAATATLRATPLDLLRLLNAEGVSGVKRTRAELSGDLEVAERYAQLLKLARPDLEEEVGEMARRRAGARAR